MEMKGRLAAMVFTIVNVVVILVPLVQFLLCVEPELDFPEWIFTKMGFYHKRRTCPILATVVVEIIEHMGMLVLGLSVGYYCFRKVVTPRVQILTNDHWMPYDREIMEANLREGFGRRRRRGDLLRRESLTWGEWMPYDREIMAMNLREGFGRPRRHEI